MQNKANLLVIQMNVTSLLTNDYENRGLVRAGKKTNQTQFFKNSRLLNPV
jgi:hypothetical protein